MNKLLLFTLFAPTGALAMENQNTGPSTGNQEILQGKDLLKKADDLIATFQENFKKHKECTLKLNTSSLEPHDLARIQKEKMELVELLDKGRNEIGAAIKLTEQHRKPHPLNIDSVEQLALKEKDSCVIL